MKRCFRAEPDKGVVSHVDCVNCSYKMEDAINKAFSYAKSRKDDLYADEVLNKKKDYFESNPDFEADLTFGILKYGDSRYQDIFNQLKSEGYNPRVTNYMDRIVTQSITIYCDDKEFPDKVEDIVGNHPELGIYHVQSKKLSSGKYAIKFELRDETLRDIDREAWREYFKKSKLNPDSLNSSVKASSQHPTKTLKSTILEVKDGLAIIRCEEKKVDWEGNLHGQKIVWYDVCQDEGEGDTIESFKTLAAAKKFLAEY